MDTLKVIVLHRLPKHAKLFPHITEGHLLIKNENGKVYNVMPMWINMPWFKISLLSWSLMRCLHIVNVMVDFSYWPSFGDFCCQILF